MSFDYKYYLIVILWSPMVLVRYCTAPSNTSSSGISGVDPGVQERINPNERLAPLRAPSTVPPLVSRINQRNVGSSGFRTVRPQRNQNIVSRTIISQNNQFSPI